jgi:NAD(P)-dependent dehydrogenase (short-subunit alcohol dehydrogenase family)
MKIEGKVAIVTGGASGLGRATVERFLADGAAAVAAFDRAAGADAGGGAAFAVDVADEASVGAAIEDVMARFGRIDILVNCAGIGVAGRTVGRKGPLPLADFTRVVTINLIGTFNVIRLAAERMIANDPDPDTGERGVIVNTASIAAYEGQMGQAAYSASKAGVVGMTLPVARDLSQFGIRVNTIAPGLFATPMIAAIPEGVMTDIVGQLEFPKRAGAPAEYADLAAFLVRNAYINAEVIRLDAGTRPPPR